MNKAESTSLKNKLNLYGWEEAINAEEADLVILNTCSVRKTAEDRLFGRIGRYKSLKKHHPISLAVIGCMAERYKEKLLEIEPEIDLLVGNFDKDSFVEKLEEGFSDDKSISSKGSRRTMLQQEAKKVYHFSEIYGDKNNFKAFIPIIHGCNNFCTYCIVPYVRGREVSRSPMQIFGEVDHLLSGNVKEITLLGQNVNSYYYLTEDKEYSFPLLLEELCRRTPEDLWIRFLTSHPKDFSDHLIDVIKNNKQLCRHIHLPVQHGSDKILALMNRKYTRGFYIDLVEKIKKSLPDVSLSTDIMVGFPGESEEDVEQTVELLRDVEFEEAFTYYYNLREGTPAGSMRDQVPDEIKLKRLWRIIEVQDEISRNRKKERVGCESVVLVEGVSKRNNTELLGRTERNEMVVVPGNKDLIGKFLRIRAKSLRGKTLYGEVIGKG